MSNTTVDLAIIGSGPGGYVAAIRAAQLGMKVAIIEEHHLGGICLNWGCIPTKALLRTAEIAHTLHHLEDFGISKISYSFDMEKIVQRSRSVANKLSSGIQHLLKKNKVQIIEGRGTLAGAPTAKGVEVIINKKDQKTQSLMAKKVIIATGASPRVLPGLEPDGTHIWTYREALLPAALPKSLLVVGSGAIGIEFASFYRTLGAEVTVIEIQPRILMAEDEEIAALAHKAFEKQGIKILTQTSIKNLKKKADSLEIQLTTPKGEVSLTVEKVISAVGVMGNTKDLGLEKTRVKVENNQIQTDAYGLTAEEGIYAIGDVAGAPWLAHKASHQGILCVEHIAGLTDLHPIKKEVIPGCTYSLPQIASVGLTEKRALEAGHKIKVGRFPYLGNGKAVALGETEGLIKTIFDQQTGELLGAHMIGAEVTEMIQGFVIAKSLETTEKELMNTIFPHPTLSEMMHESVLDAYQRVIHF
jgi:dihydrolipoamide dehydrogenase